MGAFCPGHITGFFTIDISDPDPLKRGSRGAGFCVEAGATASVRVQESSETIIDVKVDGMASEAPVTKQGIGLLLPEGKWNVKADIRLDAPVGQGLGMSAAGTFAACLALAATVRMPEPKANALRVTHIAEVESGTGLGDAVAQSVGGFARRRREGIPPFGTLERINWEPEDVVVCVLDPPLSTTSIISSAEKRNEINKAGSRCLAIFSERRGVSDFLQLSWRFANETGLATEKVKEALGSIRGLGEGSMVMLGNAIFAFGDTAAMADQLTAFGRVIRTRTYHTGASIVQD